MVKKQKIWTVKSKRVNYTWKAELWGYWEIDGSAISDDYIPEETSALDLYFIWVDSIKGCYQDNLIPIYWYIEARNPRGKFESMPFCFQSKIDEYNNNFLTYYEHPYDENGTQLRWVDIPVVDKFWKKGSADKGGFIQQATGWKPAILQPYVYLDMLTDATLSK